MQFFTGKALQVFTKKSCLAFYTENLKVTNINVYNFNINVGNGLGWVGWVHMSLLWVGLGQKADGSGWVEKNWPTSISEFFRHFYANTCIWTWQTRIHCTIARAALCSLARRRAAKVLTHLQRKNYCIIVCILVSTNRNIMIFNSGHKHLLI